MVRSVIQSRLQKNILLLSRMKDLFIRPLAVTARQASESFSRLPKDLLLHHFSCILSNSNNLKAHYSFDYAQQVHFPSDPMQPGPVCFLTPRKCSVFGVNLEAIPRQVNFLTDEAGSCGKGSNVVVSQLHYFFKHHGLGEKEVFIHADNCSGQNKNSAMLH